VGWDFDGTSVTVEIAPDDGLWSDSPTWVDITEYVRDILIMATSGRTSNIDQSQPGSLQVVVDNTARTFDGAYGPAYVTFNGAVSNSWTCPDSADFAGAGALDVRFAYAPTDWTPAGADTIIGQYGAAGQRSWRVVVTTAGYLQLTTSTNGTAVTSRDGGIQVSAVNGQPMACRVVWSNVTGETSYYCKRTTPARAVADCQSDDDWITAGVTDTGVTHTLWNSTESVMVGLSGDNTAPAGGALYYVQASSDLGSGVVWWPKDAASDAATSWVSSVTGETWTKVGTANTVTAQGTYYGRLGAGTPIRVTATRSATDYPMWYGYVRRTPQAYPMYGLDATVMIEATDSLGWLQDMMAPGSPAEFDVYGLAEGHFWGLHEPLNTFDAMDSLGALNATWTGARTAGLPTQTGAPGLTTSALNSTVRLIAPGEIGVDLGTACQLRFEVATTSPSDVFRVVVSDGTNTAAVCFGIGGVWYVQAPGAASAQVMATRLDAGRYTIELGYVGAFFSVSVNGIPVELTGATTTAVSIANALHVVGIGATISDIYCGSGLSAGSSMTQSGGAGDTTVARLANLMSLVGMIGLTPALVDFPSPTTTTLGPTALGVSWGELVRQVGTAEQGRIYVSRDGLLTFRSRTWTRTDTTTTTSQATFGDDTGQAPYSGITISPADRTDIINDCTVTLPSGASGRWQDDASIRAYGARPTSFASSAQSSSEAQALARHITGLRAWPKVRVTALELNPLGNTDVWTQVMTRVIGDRVTVVRTPATGEPITAAVTVEQMTHRISRTGTWTTTIQLAEAPPTAAEAGHWTVGDAVLGLIGNGWVTIPY